MKPLEMTINWGSTGATEKWYVNVDSRTGYFDYAQIDEHEWSRSTTAYTTAAVVTVNYPWVMSGTPQEVEGRLKRRIMQELEESGHVEYNDCGSRFFVETPVLEEPERPSVLANLQEKKAAIDVAGKTAPAAAKGRTDPAL